MQQIGDYVIRRLLGEGGMGRVYEAEERLSKRRVAIKVLHRELARTDAGRRLFLNEMQILALLEHPNIVRSLSNVELDGELVMVLEYLDGCTLRQTLTTEGSLPWQRAADIAASIAAALVAAHGLTPPVVHRDLKPENIMVQESGAIKVMDFGIAKALQVAGQTNTQSVGTLQYMSPEQIDARGIDHRSDLYCLGLVFYEMLAGRPPFQSASPRELLNLQCTAEPPPFDEELRAALPQGIEELVFQLLEKAPEDRPFLAEDVIEKLAPFRSAAARPGPRNSISKTASKTTRDDRRSRSSVAEATSGRSSDDADASLASDLAPRLASASKTPKAARTPSAEARGSQSPPLERGSNEGSGTEREDRGRQDGRGQAAGQRADTIALIDRAAASPEVGTRTGVAIVVVLSVLAGVGTYWARRSQESGDARPAVSASPNFDGTTRDDPRPFGGSNGRR